MGSLRRTRLPIGVVLAVWILAAACLAGTGECRRRRFHRRMSVGADMRSHTASVEDFGAVGDGVTSNTAAFREAVANLSCYESDGGATLFVPEGRWLTGPFNLTSRFTLYLRSGAVILASQDFSEYPIIAPLPSYGRGRDLPGGRYTNFIMGSNLEDVVITGENGTIDGQGEPWWQKFHNKELNYTRGYLVELMFSNLVRITNVTFVNASSWFIHPVYSSNVLVSGVTILAPTNSPNTDGIDPDSCSDVWIEDCFIVSGDDCIAIKSGWDQYGIAFNRPSDGIYIRRLTCISPSSAVIALGSEMSGGIRNVRAEDITAIHSESGVRIKTAVGRGGFVKDVNVQRMNLHTMKWVFWMTGSYGQHPDDGWDPEALPVVDGINFSDVVAENVTMAAKLEGIPGSPFTGICISNVTAEVVPSKKPIWNCTDVVGISSDVSPTPCEQLPAEEVRCPYPREPKPMPIEFFQAF